MAAQGVGEFGADHQQPFLVGFGGDDVQQRDQLAAIRQPVLHQAVVGKLGQLLNPEARVPEYLHRRPRPERVILLPNQIPPDPARVLGPDPLIGTGRDHAPHRLPGRGELLAVASAAGGDEQAGGVMVGLLESGGQHRDRWEQLTGPLIHPRLTATAFLTARNVT
jgi:hypothetical protein